MNADHEGEPNAIERAPAWDADGQPVNLEAAVADALEWLRLMPTVAMLNGASRERIERATACLRRLLERPASRAPETETTL